MIAAYGRIPRSSRDGRTSGRKKSLVITLAASETSFSGSGFLPVPDAFAVPPALPVALFLARHGRPVTLLSFPPRPFPRRPMALFAAIALPRMTSTKTLPASLQQTYASAWTPGRAFAPLVFPIVVGACRILGRAHGSMAPGKLMPRRGVPSSPRRWSGSVQTQHSIAEQSGPVRSRLYLVFSRPWRRGCQLMSPSVLFSHLWRSRLGAEV